VKGAEGGERRKRVGAREGGNLAICILLRSLHHFSDRNEREGEGESRYGGVLSLMEARKEDLQAKELHLMKVERAREARDANFVSTEKPHFTSKPVCEMK